MNILVSLIAIIISLICIFIIGVVLLSDIRNLKKYNAAVVCHGVVLQSNGNVYMDTYGSGIAHQQRRKYEKYYVEYKYNETLYREEVLTKQRKLQPGEAIDVHVYIADDGKREIISDIYKQRLSELLIGVIGGIILAVFCILYRNKG